MKKNLFEMGADLGDGWNADNKSNNKKALSTEIKQPQEHRLHFSKEKRRGKIVTIVKPFYLSKNELQSILKKLKKSLGVGGTVKNDTLEFQGDLAGKLRDELSGDGFKFK